MSRSAKDRTPPIISARHEPAGIFRIDVDQRGGAISHPIPKGPVNGKSGNYFIPNDNPVTARR